MFSTQDVFLLMAQGNPGALSVLIQVFKRGCFEEVVFSLHSQDITGSNIWIHYKDIHNEDIEAFCKAFGGF